MFAVVPSALATTPSPMKLNEINVVPIPTPSSLTSTPVRVVLIIFSMTFIASASCQSTPLAVETKI
jgi:hypothetical protein